MQLPVRLGNLSRVSGLIMKRDINLGAYRIGADLAILSTSIRRPFLEPRNVDHSVNNGVSDMHALRTKLPRKRLAQSAQGELAGGERAEQRGAPDGSGRACDDERRRMRGVGD